MSGEEPSISKQPRSSGEFGFWSASWINGFLAYAPIQMENAFCVIGGNFDPFIL
jgi:hypothetical protein